MSESMVKMTDQDCIVRLVRCVMNNCMDDFPIVVQKYIDSKKDLKNSSIASRLQYMLSNRKSQIRPLTLKQLPTETQQLFSISDYRKKDLILDEFSKNLYAELLLEWKNKNIFQEHNLNVRNKILLHGETGNGKTTFVRNIAIDAGLPLYEIKQDQLISSKLGNTAKNISTIFSSIHDECIVFLDEIDSIAIKRGHSNDHGEVNRMTNVLLIEIEKINSNIIFICATNRIEEIDTAFLRRLDIIHKMPAPDINTKNKYVTNFCESHNLSISNADEICENNLSFSAIEKELITIARKKVIEIIKRHSN